MYQQKYLNSLRIFELALGLVLFLVLGLFWLKLIKAPWSDSEIWSFQVAKSCWTSEPLTTCWSKPFFYLGMSAITQLTESLPQALEFGRFLTGFFWVVSAVVAVRRFQHSIYFIPFFLSSVFWFDSMQVRSDFWALPFIVFFIAENERRPRLSFLSALIAFLMTPKSGLLLFPLLFFFEHKFSWRSFKFQKYRSLFICLIIVLGLMIVLDQTLVKAFLNSWREEVFGFSWWALERWRFILRAFVENPFLFLGFVWLTRKLILKTPSLALRSFVVLIPGLLFPEKLPFWVSAWLLCLLTLAVHLNGPEISKTQAWSIRIFAVGAILLGGLWIQKSVQLNSDQQIDFIQSLSELQTKHPGLRIYDGIGLAYSSRAELPYLGPAEGESALVLLNEQLDAGVFDLVLFTHRLDSVRSEIENSLRKRYCPINVHLWVHCFVEIRDLRRKNWLSQKKPLYEIKNFQGRNRFAFFKTDEFDKLLVYNPTELFQYTLTQLVRPGIFN